MIANGYKNEVIFPIQVVLKKEHSPLFLKAKLDYLACDIANCIPQTKIVTLTIPDKPNILSPNAEKIVYAINHLPENSDPTYVLKSAQFIQNENAPSYLRLSIFHKFPLVSPEIFIEGAQKLFFDKMLPINTEYSTSGEVSIIDIPIYKNEKRELVYTANLIGKQLTITIENGDKAIENVVSVVAPPLGIGYMVFMLGVALLGGFILNFMPCVLPVILLKFFSLTRYGDRQTHALRKALSLSILGIISSFMVLALIPILLGMIGISFGWGMQFQEPMFLVFMMLILTLFAANFWGLFEIILPDRMTALGHLYSGREGNVGHFLTGMFTTLLATPCSAPYLGTAVSFALSRGPFEILLIFFFISLGLALPLIIVAIFPKMATYLPKPGKWMLVFKKILGWGFFFTMLWLFYVLTSQASLLSAFFILSVMLSFLLVLWLVRMLPTYNKALIWYTIFVPLLISASLFTMSMQEKQVAPQQLTMKQDLNNIKSSIANGKIVFVDVTADWCLSCKANEYFVLDTNSVKNLMKKNDVVLIKIDWTSKNPDVYEYLKSFNHNGIPFYTVYGPHNPYGQTLPQLLTFSTVDEAIKKAK